MNGVQEFSEELNKKIDDMTRSILMRLGQSQELPWEKTEKPGLVLDSDEIFKQWVRDYGPPLPQYKDIGGGLRAEVPPSDVQRRMGMVEASAAGEGPELTTGAKILKTIGGQLPATLQDPRYLEEARKQLGVKPYKWPEAYKYIPESFRYPTQKELEQLLETEPTRPYQARLEKAFDPLAQYTTQWVNMMGGGLPEIGHEKLWGEELPKPKTTLGQVGKGAGHLAGMIRGPFKLVGKGWDKVIKWVPTTSAGSIAHGVLKTAATIGGGSALATWKGEGNVFQNKLNAFYEGATTGAVFGVTGLMNVAKFPILSQVFRTVVTSDVLDRLSGESIWDDRAIWQKVYSYGLNAYFMRHGISPRAMAERGKEIKAEEAKKRKQIEEEILAENKAFNKDLGYESPEYAKDYILPETPKELMNWARSVEEAPRMEGEELPPTIPGLPEAVGEAPRMPGRAMPEAPWEEGVGEAPRMPGPGMAPALGMDTPTHIPMEGGELRPGTQLLPSEVELGPGGEPVYEEPVERKPAKKKPKTKTTVTVKHPETDKKLVTIDVEESEPETEWPEFEGGIEKEREKEFETEGEPEWVTEVDERLFNRAEAYAKQFGEAKLKETNPELYKTWKEGKGKKKRGGPPAGMSVGKVDIRDLIKRRTELWNRVQEEQDKLEELKGELAYAGPGIRERIAKQRAKIAKINQQHNKLSEDIQRMESGEPIGDSEKTYLKAMERKEPENYKILQSAIKKAGSDKYDSMSVKEKMELQDYRRTKGEKPEDYIKNEIDEIEYLLSELDGTGWWKGWSVREFGPLFDRLIHKHIPEYYSRATEKGIANKVLNKLNKKLGTIRTKAPEKVKPIIDKGFDRMMEDSIRKAFDPVADGEKAVGSIHVDESRGGIEELRARYKDIKKRADRKGLEVLVVQEDHPQAGKRVHLFVYNKGRVAEILKEVGLKRTPESFLKESALKDFPKGTRNREAIDKLFERKTRKQQLEEEIERGIEEDTDWFGEEEEGVPDWLEGEKIEGLDIPEITDEWDTEGIKVKGAKKTKVRGRPRFRIGDVFYWGKGAGVPFEVIDIYKDDKGKVQYKIKNLHRQTVSTVTSKRIEEINKEYGFRPLERWSPELAQKLFGVRQPHPSEPWKATQQEYWPTVSEYIGNLFGMREYINKKTGEKEKKRDPVLNKIIWKSAPEYGMKGAKVEDVIGTTYEEMGKLYTPDYLITNYKADVDKYKTVMRKEWGSDDPAEWLKKVKSAKTKQKKKELGSKYRHNVSVLNRLNKSYEMAKKMSADPTDPAMVRWWLRKFAKYVAFRERGVPLSKTEEMLSPLEEFETEGYERPRRKGEQALDSAWYTQKGAEPQELGKTLGRAIRDFMIGERVTFPENAEAARTKFFDMVRDTMPKSTSKEMKKHPKMFQAIFDEMRIHRDFSHGDSQALSSIPSAPQIVKWYNERMKTDPSLPSLGGTEASQVKRVEKAKTEIINWIRHHPAALDWAYSRIANIEKKLSEGKVLNGEEANQLELANSIADKQYYYSGLPVHEFPEALRKVADLFKQSTGDRVRSIADALRMPYWDRDLNPVVYELLNVEGVGREASTIAFKMANEYFKKENEGLVKAVNDALIEEDTLQRRLTDGELMGRLNPAQVRMYRGVREALDYIQRDFLSRMLTKLGMEPREATKFLDEHYIPYYIPHMRFGRWAVIFTGGPRGKVALDFSMFDTEAEANEYRDRVMREEPTIKRGKQNYKIANVKVVDTAREWKDPSSFMAVLHHLPIMKNVLESRLGYPETTVYKFLQMVPTEYHKYFAKGRLAHRKDIRGWEKENLTKSLKKYLSGVPYSYAKRFSHPKIEDIFSKVPEYKKKQARDLIDFFYGRKDWEGQLSQGVRGFMYDFYLGLKPSFYLVNHMQRYGTTYPWMLTEAGKNGTKYFTKAQGQEWKLFSDWLKGIKSGKGKLSLEELIRSADYLTDMEKKILTKMDYMGELGAPMVRELRGKEAKSPWSMFGFWSERSNRLQAALSAVKVAEERGMAYKDALEYTRRGVWDTQFAYSKATRAWIARGNVRSPLMIFKSYPMNYVNFLADQLRRGGATKTGFKTSLGITLALSGLRGLPFYEQLRDLAFMGAQQIFKGLPDDEDHDEKTWRQQMMEFEERFSDGLFKRSILSGIPHVLGIDGAYAWGSNEITGFAATPMVKEAKALLDLFRKDIDLIEKAARISPTMLKHTIRTARHLLENKLGLDPSGKPKLTPQDIERFPQEIRGFAREFFQTIPKAREIGYLEKINYFLGFPGIERGREGEQQWQLKQLSRSVIDTKSEHHRAIAKILAKADIKPASKTWIMRSATTGQFKDMFRNLVDKRLSEKDRKKVWELVKEAKQSGVNLSYRSVLNHLKEYLYTELQ